MKTSPQIKAAVLYLVPAAIVLGIWYVLLFKGNAQDSSTTSTLVQLLTESPKKSWFLWLLSLPALFLGLSISYASPASRSRRGAQTLLVIGIGVAACTWLTVSAEIAVFASLPVLYGLLSARRANQGGGENGA